jgi:multicomponent K+:H+ antiporter subunit G
MSDVLQIFSGLCMLLGAFLFFASGVALWRMPDVYTRMHGPTKAASLGLAFLALGALIDDAVEGAGFWLEELLILLFVCLTVPISAQILMRAAARRAQPADDRTHGQAPAASAECRDPDSACCDE